MKLKFLGRGGAFNVNEGANSCYFIDNKNLFIIDTGESIYKELINRNLFKNINNIYIIITHTHPDHVSSLVSIIFYNYYLTKNKIYITTLNQKHNKDIIDLLRIYGTKSVKYEIIDIKSLDNKFKLFNKIRYVETTHTLSLSACYGIEIYTNNGLIYYTGDTNNINQVLNYLKIKDSIIYCDTTSLDYIDNPHLYINYLIDNISIIDRKRIYCMHFNNEECIDIALKNGFNVVNVA